MSFSFTGGATSWLRRTTGNISSTGTFTTTRYVKRTANFSGMKALLAMRPSGDATGHELFTNDPTQTAYKLNLHANYGFAQAHTDDPLALNVWTPVAVVGSGGSSGSISVKYLDDDGSTVITETVGQTAFTPAFVGEGDAGANAHLFTGRMAHLRWWNAALSDAEILAEWASAEPVRTSNLVSAHSGGVDLATALQGEFGTAYTNMGAVAYNADMPVFDTFTGVVVSGESNMPYEAAAVVGERINRMLHSGDLSQSVWAKQGNEVVGGAAAAPAGYGTSQRILMKIDTGGVYQRLTGIPQGHQLAYMLARRVDTDYVCFRHMAADFGSGQQGIFNLATGQWAVTGAFGGNTGGTFGSRSLGNGWYLIYIAATISGDRIIEFYPTVGTDQLPAVGKSIDVAAFQEEDVIGGVVQATYHKPTTSAAVARSLASVAVTVSTPSIGVGQQATATVQLSDDAGAPWDQFGPVTVVSSDTGKATATNTSGAKTDFSGRLTVPLTGVALGSTTVTATAGDFTSAGVTLTVSSGGVLRWVRAITRGGYESTSGWHACVWRKSTTTRFPSTAPLFQVSGQKFSDTPFGDNSYMDIAVPAGVSVAEGEIVEIVIENDNINGKPIDGPGMFEAQVI